MAIWTCQDLDKCYPSESLPRFTFKKIAFFPSITLFLLWVSACSDDYLHYNHVLICIIITCIFKVLSSSHPELPDSTDSIWLISVIPVASFTRLYTVLLPHIRDDAQKILDEYLKAVYGSFPYILTNRLCGTFSRVHISYYWPHQGSPPGTFWVVKPSHCGSQGRYCVTSSMDT